MHPMAPTNTSFYLAYNAYMLMKSDPVPRILLKNRSLQYKPCAMQFDRDDAGNFTLTMSNYSVYFLLQSNGLDLNCSVYSLTLGTLNYSDYYSHQWLGNLSGFLPAYYVTNCSITDLQNQIKSLSQNVSDVLQWMDDFKRNPYNVADNGDSFVALLFMILGLCVSCWMLMLLFLLLPKHKRKPVLTQVATLLYLVVLTIILAKMTEEARRQYYADSLDMIKILGLVYERKKYSIALIISQFLTNLAFLQLVVKMSHLQWKRINCTVGICLIITYLVVSAVAQAEVIDYFTYVSSSKLVAPSLKVTAKLLIVIWFAISLAYHTIWGTASSPRQVSYSKKLLPLAFITWFMVGVHFVISLLTVSLWRETWLITSWMTFLPNLIEMYILTCTWEWFYSIRDLELRLELVGMLGRRISIDDVMSFSNAMLTQRETIRGRFAYIRDFFFGKAPKDLEPKTKDIPSSATYSTCTATHTLTPTLQSGENVQEVDLSEGLPLTDLGDVRLEQESVHSEQGNTHRGEVSGSQASDNIAINDDHEDGDDHYSYEVEYVDDYDMWNMDDKNDNMNSNENHSHNNCGNTRGVAQVGSSRDLAGQGANEDLPPFRPHPGFNADDYWDDK